MRVLTAVVLAMPLLGLASAAVAQEQTDSLDLDKIYDAADSIAGLPVVDSLPTEINCPKFDPRKIRGGADQFSFETAPALERRPQHIEATIEFVVKRDGQVERRQTKVIRSSEYRLNRSLENWIRTCRFRPGKIGEYAVKVRMRKTWRFRLDP